jgi:glycosyltransferase involved in cell wall biosynthesis
MVQFQDISCHGIALHSYNGQGPGQTFIEIMNGLQSSGLNSVGVLPRLRTNPGFGLRLVEALPFPVKYLPWLLVREFGISAAERELLTGIKTDISKEKAVFTFPDLSLTTMRQIKYLGVPIIREMTNLHRGEARRIISVEHEREELPAFVDITEQSIEEEIASLELSDAIVAPNAFVRKSLIENGVASNRIHDASYGWSNKRLPAHGRKHSFRVPGQRVALFVGRVSYQKGAHLLLRAWHRAGCPGKLVLAGTVESELAARHELLLKHPSIEIRGFVDNIGTLYSEADYFVFPSLLEGGPQVCYEAAAYGLPMVVSPMGAGRAWNSVIEGVNIVEPHDIEAIAEVLTRLSVHDGLAEMSDSVRVWADGYEWGRRGSDRASIVRSVLGQLPTAANGGAL